MGGSAANRIRLLALDVDGVLTDGRISYDSHGSELKTFHIRDGLGIKLAQGAGIRIAIITGRDSIMVTRRATELGIELIVQGRDDKYEALSDLARSLGLGLDEVAYMGDDLPDLKAIQAAGVGMTVADAQEEVRRAADWIASLPGGQGAVREACDWLLKQQSSYQRQIEPFGL